MIDNENTPQPLAEIPIGPSEFEQFLDRNQKRLIFFAILIVLAGAAIIVHRGLKATAEKSAAAALVLTYDEVTGRYDVEALRAMETDHAGTPAARTSVYLLAEALWAEGKMEESLKIFEEFLVENPSGELHDKALLALAEHYRSSGDTEKALDTYGRLLDTGNEAYSPIALINMGDMYRASGDVEKARQCYEKVTREYSESSFGYSRETASETPSAVIRRLDLLGVEEPELRLPANMPALTPGAPLPAPLSVETPLEGK